MPAWVSGPFVVPFCGFAYGGSWGGLATTYQHSYAVIQATTYEHRYTVRGRIDHDRADAVHELYNEQSAWLSA